MSGVAGVRVGRVYDEPGPQDGMRVLADRLWPRGLRRDDPRVGEWRPDVAPSSELRRWYDHVPERFDEFCRRYEHELAEPTAEAALDELRRVAAVGPLTLVTASRHLEASHLVVLAALVADHDTPTEA
ncbi:DUF488 domain-containing protein [Cellulomonas composti]|uniref:MarR family transcriptional regulator n=1 Tax=Cellulomonas composti TaxID=266130 RepID=A0A511JEQ5_9CELL|nr:DUF488 family protein [Cellulomonas composti]GEL96223.1 hypothetical protein CCO02nite_28810 [Cellulomonas composti]